MSTKFRPKEIAAWIKSKKKTVTPSIKADKFGAQFMEWWKGMQPEWRSDSDGMLIQDTPPGEDWVSVNKGGSAGMYFVVVSLSWWVMAEGTGADNSLNAWSAVADISWWFREMRNRALIPNSRGKRGHDEEEEEDSQLKKK